MTRVSLFAFGYIPISLRKDSKLSPGPLVAMDRCMTNQSKNEVGGWLWARLNLPSTKAGCRAVYKAARAAYIEARPSVTPAEFDAHVASFQSDWDFETSGLYPYEQLTLSALTQVVSVLTSRHEVMPSEETLMWDQGAIGSVTFDEGKGHARAIACLGAA